MTGTAQSLEIANIVTTARCEGDNPIDREKQAIFKKSNLLSPLWPNIWLWLTNWHISLIDRGMAADMRKSICNDMDGTSKDGFG
jgi:hypothetical protein